MKKPTFKQTKLFQAKKDGTVSYEDRKSTWNSGAQKAIRPGSEEEVLRKQRGRVIGLGNMIANQDDESM